MIQVKFISSSIGYPSLDKDNNSLNKIEKAINDWITENKSKNIIDIKFNITGTADYNNNLLATIIYENKPTTTRNNQEEE